MAYRVVQWATGGIGSESLRIIAHRPDLELVGALVYSPEKAGRDAGEIAGIAPTGITATADKEAIFALEADCVVHLPRQHRDMTEHKADVLRLLESGKNVISGIDFFHPQTHDPEWAARVEEACTKGRSTLMGLGNQPGFVCERLTTTITSMCSEISSIEVVERMELEDISAAGATVMGFGLTPDEFAASRAIEMWDSMYRQVPGAVCAILGAEVDRIDSETTTVLAERDLPIAAQIRNGTVAGIGFRWTAIVDGAPFFSLETRWVCDADLPGWEAPNDWVIIVEGRPSLRLTLERAHSFAGGVKQGGHSRDGHSTVFRRSCAALLTNAIPGVTEAPPGHFLAPVFGAYQHRRGS